MSRHGRVHHKLWGVGRQEVGGGVSSQMYTHTGWASLHTSLAARQSTATTCHSSRPCSCDVYSRGTIWEGRQAWRQWKVIHTHHYTQGRHAGMEMPGMSSTCPPPPRELAQSLICLHTHTMPYSLFIEICKCKKKRRGEVSWRHEMLRRLSACLSRIYRQFGRGRPSLLPSPCVQWQHSCRQEERKR